MFPITRETDERHMRPITATPRILISSSLVLILLLLLFVPSRVAAVEYEIRFDATWSAATHPGAYPSNAHFSPLIGATHNNQVTFWELGGIASSGIEQMAEVGSTSTLQSEFEAAAGDTDTIILAGGRHNSPGSKSTTFDIVPSHSLVTLVSMVAPSPDWFVGVTRLDLRNGDAWVPQLTVDLFAYDAGTDSGVDFTSSNADITPHIPITMLEAPFTGTSALGTFTFTLLGDFDIDGDIDGADFLKWQRGESSNPFSAADLANWLANFGTVAPLTATSTAVPEPSTWLMLMLGMAAMLFHRYVVAS